MKNKWHNKGKNGLAQLLEHRTNSEQWRIPSLERSGNKNCLSQRNPGGTDAAISDLFPAAASRWRSWSGIRCSEELCCHCHQPGWQAALASVGSEAGARGGRWPPQQGWMTSGWTPGTTLDWWYLSSASERSTDSSSRRLPTWVLQLGC